MEFLNYICSNGIIPNKFKDSFIISAVAQHNKIRSFCSGNLIKYTKMIFKKRYDFQLHDNLYKNYLICLINYINNYIIYVGINLFEFVQ